MLPSSARSHYTRAQRLQLAALLAVRKAWRRIKPDGNWQEQYDSGIGAQILAVLAAAQVAAARESDRYVAEVLVEIGIVASASQNVVVPSAFAGVAGDGRDLAGLLSQSVVQAGLRFNTARAMAEATLTEQRELIQQVGEFTDVATVPEPVLRFEPVQEARKSLDDTEKWLDMVAQSIMADSMRAAESAAMVAHPEVAGYVRMLNPPSCSRCAILAGLFYKWNSGFERHPRCECIHIPAQESLAEDLRVDVGRYFESLDRAEQDKIFTVKGAQAIRDGADVNQVVNARRGMERAQVYGRDVLITSEGTTRRGLAYRPLNERLGRDRDVKTTGRYKRTSNVRLMPDAIYQIAGDDRAEAIRLLKLHGFITT